jgi:hypothetical protein
MLNSSISVPYHLESTSVLCDSSCLLKKIKTDAVPAYFDVSICVEKGSLVISKQPQPVECSFGDSVTFEVEAESFELLSYQWFKDEEKLVGKMTSCCLVSKPRTVLSNTFFVCVFYSGWSVKMMMYY